MDVINVSVIYKSVDLGRHQHQFVGKSMELGRNQCQCTGKSAGVECYQRQVESVTKLKLPMTHYTYNNTYKPFSTTTSNSANSHQTKQLTSTLCEQPRNQLLDQ